MCGLWNEDLKQLVVTFPHMPLQNQGLSCKAWKTQCIISFIIMFTGGSEEVKVFQKLLTICNAVELVTANLGLTYDK